MTVSTWRVSKKKEEKKKKRARTTRLVPRRFPSQLPRAPPTTSQSLARTIPMPQRCLGRCDGGLLTSRERPMPVHSRLNWLVSNISLFRLRHIPNHHPPQSGGRAVLD